MLNNAANLAAATFNLNGGATVNLPDASDIDGASFNVAGGVTLSVPDATSYVERRTSAFLNDYLTAGGSNSVLNLSSLTTISGSTGAFATLTISATSGGYVDLHNLTSLTGYTGAFGQLNITASSGGYVDLRNLPNYTTGSVQVLADGANSVVNLSGMTSFSASNATNGAASITARNGGTVLMGSLTALNLVNIVMDGTGTMATSQIVSYTNGTATISGVAPNFSGLTNAAGSTFNLSGSVALMLNNAANLAAATFNLNGGATVNLPSASDIDGASFNVAGGVTLSVPDATSYVKPDQRLPERLPHRRRVQQRAEPLQPYDHFRQHGGVCHIDHLGDRRRPCRSAQPHEPDRLHGGVRPTEHHGLQRRLCRSAEPAQLYHGHGPGPGRWDQQRGEPEQPDELQRQQRRERPGEHHRKQWRDDPLGAVYGSNFRHEHERRLRRHHHRRRSPDPEYRHLDNRARRNAEHGVAPVVRGHDCRQWAAQSARHGERRDFAAGCRRQQLDIQRTGGRQRSAYDGGQRHADACRERQLEHGGDRFRGHAAGEWFALRGAGTVAVQAALRWAAAAPSARRRTSRPAASSRRATSGASRSATRVCWTARSTGTWSRSATTRTGRRASISARSCLPTAM